MMNRTCSVSVSVIAAVLIGGTASASSLGPASFTYHGVGLSEKVDIHYSGANPTVNLTNISAGELRYTLLAMPSGAGASLVGQSIRAFCSDIWQTAQGGDGGVYGLADVPISPGVTPMGPQRASLISSLYRTVGWGIGQQGTSNNTTFWTNVLSNFGSAATAGQAAAAFQLAIWEIAHDDGFDAGAIDFAGTNLDVTDGNFSATANADVTSLANSMLMAAWGAWTGAPSGLLSVAGNNGQNNFQDFIIIIPLPAPVMMAGLGLLALPLLRRRMVPRRQNKT